jgi:hypothetical protein
MGQDSDDPTAKSGGTNGSQCGQSTGPSSWESRKLEEALRVSLGGPGHRNHDFVARHFALETDLPFQPPHRRMPTHNDADQQLNNVRDIIAALHVRPFVDYDAIEIDFAEVLEQCRRYSDDGPTASEDSSRSNVVREHHAGRAPGGAQARPVTEADFDFVRKLTTTPLRIVKGQSGDDESASMNTGPYGPESGREHRRCPPCDRHRDERVECGRRIVRR